MTSDDMIEGNIVKYYLFKFFMGMSFWVPIYILFFLSMGFNYTQIMFFTVTIAVFQIIFEVPSGIYADKFGRKDTLLISMVLKVIQFGLFLTTSSFTSFMVASAFFGISLAFRSGSMSAFIYDTLRDLKRESEFKRIDGKAHTFYMFAMALGSIMGGSLAIFGFRLPLLLSTTTTLIAGIVVFTFREPKHHKPDADIKYFDHLKAAAHFSYKHARVKWLLVFSAVIVGILIASQKFTQPYMQLAGIDLVYFGVFYLAYLLMSAFASYVAHPIDNFLGELGSLIAIMIVLGASLLIVGLHVFTFGVFFWLLTNVVYGYSQPIIANHINKHVASHHRATVLSLGGFLESIFGGVLAVLLGYVADMYAITTALLIIGILTFAIGIPALIMFGLAKRS